MTLNEFVSGMKKSIHEELRQGGEPSVGTFDAKLLAEGCIKGDPLIGAASYFPDAVTLEFVFPDPKSAATVLVVRVDAPERIVFMPVPEWVIESIWQGEIDGSYQFESDAEKMMGHFREELSIDGNLKWFGPRPAKRRE